MYLVPNIHPGSGSAGVPTVTGNFAVPASDWTTLSTLSSMPSGGSISRNGNAMLYDSTGKLTYAPNNLLLNTAALSTQSVTTAAISYILSFKGTGSVALSGAYSGSLAGTGATDRVYLKFTSTAASLTLTVTGTVTEAQLEAVTYQTTPSTYVATTSAAYYGPRFDYDPSTLAAKGLLIEGQRTNLVTYSNIFSNAAWSVASVSAALASSFTSPDGTSNSYLITQSTISGYMYQGVSVSANTTYTISVYLKAGTKTSVRLHYAVGGFSSECYVDVNMSAGTIGTATNVGSATGASATIQSVGNGWYRVALSGNLASATTGYFILGSDATTGNYYAFSAQFEQAAFASSYVLNATTGTTTRAAETFAITGYSSNLIEAYYTDEATGNSYSFPYNAGVNPSSSFGWTTSLRVYTNAYAGDIASPSWIDNSGTTGNRMYYDSTGTLTWAPSNMFQRSQELDLSPWSTTALNSTVSANQSVAPDGSNTADLIYPNATGASSYITQNVTTLNANYIYSFYVKAAGKTSGFVYAIGGATYGVYYFDLSNATTQVVSGSTSTGTISLISVGNGWYRVSIVNAFSAASNPIGVGPCDAKGSTSITKNGTDGLYVWGAQLEPVTYQTSPRAYIPTTSAAVYQPRYDYSPATVPAQPLGMLIEESRANLLTYSNIFTSWSAFGTSNITPNSDIAPDGTMTATMQASAANNGVQISTSGISANTTYTYSIYAKAQTATSIRLSYATSGGTVVSGLQDISISSGSPVGNGWYRVAYTFTTGAGNTSLTVRAQTSSTGAYLMFGAQLEAGSFATSYIPTTTASVTRVADVVKLTGSALTTFQGSSSSAVLESNLLSATNGRFLLGYSTTSGAFAVTNNTIINNYDALSSPTSITVTAGSGGLTSVCRVAAGYDATTRTLVFNNGTLGTTNARGTTITAANIGSLTNGNSIANGWYRSLAFYSQRLPDAVLKSKSSVGAPY